MISTDEQLLRRIEETIRDHEDKLSDGFGWYSDDGVQLLAKSILAILKDENNPQPQDKENT